MLAFGALPPAEVQFGKYQLLDRIAAGGMAEIFRARYQAAAGVTKPVVIKKILPHYAGNRNFIQMFQNEARIVMGLSHGNIAQVFDFGEIDGEYYLAMEFVHGQPLSKVLRRARELEIPVFPTPFAVFIALEMCRGLHYAHSRLDETGRPLNIVHRDVSPQNVILSYEGQVKLVDFGIAKARSVGGNETEAGAVKGKYVYFAPEQARGKELDARTDVFACGIVLYEMLCGRLPFEGKMIDVLSKIVKGQFERPRAVNPDITPALERIILTSLALEKADRYPSAQAMGEALAGYLYANAPTFSTDQLSKLLAYFYEKELVDEGLPVKLPRDFLEQVPLWKKVLPGSEERSDERPTTAGRHGSRKRSADANVETRAAEPTRAAPEPKRSRSTRDYVAPKVAPAKLPRWPFLVLPGLATVIAALLVFILGTRSTFSVQLSSTPRRASVSVDGILMPNPTPVLIDELSADAPHRIQVTAPGHKPWTKEVSGAREQVVQLEAVLEPDRPPTDLAVISPPREEPAVRPAPVTTVVSDHSWPVASITVDAKAHAFDVQPTRAARIRLDPSRTYRVWTEGKMNLGGWLDNIYFEQVMYFVEGAGPAAESFGIVDRQGTTVKGATALYAWVFDNKGSDNTGAVKVRLQAKGARAVSTLLVDARENFLDLDPLRRVRLTGLTLFDRYELLVKEGTTPASLRAGKSGRVGKVLYHQTTGVSQTTTGKGPTQDHQVLEVGKRYEVTGASWMMFTFPDASASDNDGSLVIEIAPLASEPDPGKRALRVLQ